MHFHNYLIQKIYFQNSEQQLNNIYFIDKSRTTIQYFNEKVTDSKELFIRKLANNLQNSYLKGVINQNLDNHHCPNKFLEEYDIQTWNHHIYELSDQKYQKKIMSSLNIPLIYC